MRRLGRAITGSPHHPLHASDEAITVVQFVELFSGQLQSRLVDKYRKMLG